MIISPKFVTSACQSSANSKKREIKSGPAVGPKPEGTFPRKLPAGFFEKIIRPIRTHRMLSRVIPIFSCCKEARLAVMISGWAGTSCPPRNLHPSKPSLIPRCWLGQCSADRAARSAVHGICAGGPGPRSSPGGWRSHRYLLQRDSTPAPDAVPPEGGKDHCAADYAARAARWYAPAGR